MTRCNALLLAITGSLLLLAGCSKSPESTAPDGLLNHVPADTPYVFVNTKQLPEPLRSRMADYSAAQLARLNTDLAPLLEQQRADPEFQAAGALSFVEALLAEFAGRDTAGRLRELGLDPAAKAVFYGLGPLPALRMETPDAAALSAMFDRVEQRSGISWQRGESNGQAYRRVDLGPVDLVFAVTERHAVLGLLPDTLFERDLPLLLGQREPTASLAAAGEIARMIERHGFTGYGEGYFQLDALFATFLGKGTGLNAEVMQALALDVPPVSDGCVSMGTQLLADMPRLVAGVRQADAKKMVVRSVWETDPAIAANLQRLAAPVAGVGVDYDGLFAVGLGLELPQLRALIEMGLRRVVAAGASCELVDPNSLQAVMPQLNMALGPMTAGIKGFNLWLDDVQIDAQTMEPTAISGALLAAVDDPRGVLALATMFDPELAALDIPGDGSFTDLPLPAEFPATAVRIAIREKGLLMVAGQGEAKLPDALNATGVTDTPVMFSIDYGLHRLVERLGGLVEARAGAMAADGQAELADMMRDQLATFRHQATFVDRVQFSLSANSHGLVMDQAMHLR